MKFSPKYDVLLKYLKQNGSFPTGVSTVIITGGRGSGKSYPVSAILCLVLATFKRMRILFTRYTLKSAGLSIVPEFKEKIDLFGLSDHLYTVFRDHAHQVVADANDSSLIFAGIKTSGKEQTANLKSLKDVAIWVLDEAEELIYEHIYDSISLSIRSNMHRNVKILMLNPTHKRHWIYTRFFKERGVRPGTNGVVDEVLYIHTTYKDNIRNLPDSVLADYERMERNHPEKYKHVVLGGWVDQVEGLVYPGWEVRGERPENMRLLGYGLDHGFANDPAAFVKVFQVFGEPDTLFFETVFCETGLFNRDLADNIKGSAGFRRGLNICADSNERKTNDDLAIRYNLDVVGAKKGAGSVLAGIGKMKSFKCVSRVGDPISSEAVEYAWQQAKDGSSEYLNEVVKENDHCLDAARYFVNLHF